jgi:hypothetical protein
MNLTPTLKEFPLGALRNPLIDTNFPAQGLEELRVDMKNIGNLMVCFDAMDEGRVTIAGDAQLLPQRLERVGNTLVIEQKLKSHTQNIQNQKLLIEIHVPRETRINIKMLAGVVMLMGGTGDVQIEGKAGEITGVTLAQNVDIHLQAGDVNFNDLRGNVNIHVSAGSVSLGWERLSGQESVNIACGVGGIDLHLPRHAVSTSDSGGLLQEKTLRLPNGTLIHAKVNFGGLDISHWQPRGSSRMSICI